MLYFVARIQRSEGAVLRTRTAEATPEDGKTKL